MRLVRPDLIQQLRLIAGDAAEQIGLGGASFSRLDNINSTLICSAIPDLAVLGQRLGFGLFDNQL